MSKSKVSPSVRESARRELALALAVETPQSTISVQQSLGELCELAKTAGAQVLESFVQKRKHPDPRTYLGQGKLEEVRRALFRSSVNLALVDDELTPLQKRNLEEILQIKVVDRTFLILDIFAQHASSAEGKVQVELAQCLYLLPRLTGKGSSLSRLGGGIGTRGPGETKLEEERRRLQNRIAQLRREVEKLKSQRELQRKSRLATHQPLVAVVGYTNAGKSTLFNHLAKSSVYVADQLFATLDPTTRKIHLPSGHSCLLTDTVGFIRKLPTTLISSFYATLEEIRYADALLIVADGSSPTCSTDLALTEEVLKTLHCQAIPRFTLLNKLDQLVSKPPPQLEMGEVLRISAQKKWGLDLLLKKLDELLQPLRTTLSLKLPAKRAGKLAELEKFSKILSVRAQNGQLTVQLETLRANAYLFQEL